LPLEELHKIEKPKKKKKKKKKKKNFAPFWYIGIHQCWTSIGFLTYPFDMGI
jgi:hypothetical protein